MASFQNSDQKEREEIRRLEPKKERQIKRNVKSKRDVVYNVPLV
jgi:hypothetical protein